METLFSNSEDPLVDELSEDTGDQSALPLGKGKDPLRDEGADKGSEAAETVEPSRALALTDVVAPRSSAGDTLIRLAYRLGVPGHTLAAPFRRAAAMRILATVESPVRGDRAAGTALRAGHFLIHGVKTPIGQIDFDSNARLAPGLERSLHSFGWLFDLASSAPRADCRAVAERITGLWLDSNPAPAKGAAWTVEHAGLRLMALLVHAPIVLANHEGDLKPRLLAAIEETANWLDRKAARAGAGFGQVAGWAAVTAAGLLLPEGKPRRLYGEAALIKSLGDLVAEDGGVLSRCPAAQMDAIALLTNLLACYEAVEIEPPRALIVMRELLVPPLLSLRHGDGALGNWQGQGAVSADRVAALIAATGVRTRPLKDVQHWGFQRLRARETILQFDAAPPPRARHA
ncbi:MAG: heparinase, partial [Pseudomonadota bacterium]